jgi:L,D-transpeptidase catalytic domain
MVEPARDLRHLRKLMSKILATVALAILVCFLAVPLAAKTAARAASHTSKGVARTAVAESRIPPVRRSSKSEGGDPGSRSLAVDRAAAMKSGVSADVLNLAVRAVSCGIASGDLQTPPTLTLIDYSLPSTTPRLWVFDLRSGRLLFNELVAHGRNSGANMATRFSDAMESRETSLGLFRTADTYVGHNGYSLRLDGLEPGFNGNARERAIVMHGAPYVDSGVAKVNGRLGRSWGCPALREAVARQVIDTVRDGGVIFSYYPDPTWLKTSKFLTCASPAPATVATN